MSDVHAKGQGQRSKVNVTEVKTQLCSFWTITPVWIHIWWSNDAQSLMVLRRGALLFFKVFCKFQGHTAKNCPFWPKLGFLTVTLVWIHQWLQNDAQSLKWHRRGALLFSKVIFQISRSHKTKKSSILTKIGHFRTVTPVWVHWWNDAQSLNQHRGGVLLFFKVICQISDHTGQKITDFDPDWAFADCYSSLNSPMASKWCTKLDVV